MGIGRRRKINELHPGIHRVVPPCTLNVGAVHAPAKPAPEKPLDFPHFFRHSLSSDICTAETQENEKQGRAYI
jgi:hypothetical protein